MPRRSVYPLWGSLRLQRGSSLSLQDQIVEFFRTAIRERRLRPGMRVRSSRQFAQDLGVSRTTAVQAYERLVAEGYLVTQAGAGIFIAATLPEFFAVKAARRPEPRATAAENPRTGLDLSAMDGRRYELPLAPGMPALDHFPWRAWGAIFNRVFRERPLNALGYGDPQGELPLREAICEYLAGTRGISCDPGQVVVVSGTEQIIEFLASQLVSKGQSAWFENPSYPFIRRVLRSTGVDAVPIGVDADGLDVEEGMARAPQARLAVISPTHQYPLGVTMSLRRRERLIEWSRRSGAFILEHEIDGDYRYAPDPLPPLYALADTRRVIYCGSLSKPLAPGLRVNYFVGPPAILRTFALRSTLVPLFTQLVLARFNTEGHLAAHMNRMRRLYARRRALLLDALRREAAGLLDIRLVPEAGLRIAAELLTGGDDLEIAARAPAAGILVNPLSACYAEGPPRRGLILGFASTPEERILPAVRTLAGVIAG